MRGSNLAARRRRAAAMIASLLVAHACADGTTPARVDEVTIGGAPSSSLTVGDTVRLTVAVRTDQGGTVSDPGIAWRSTAQTVATVSSDGLVTAVAPGAAEIVATVDGVSDTVALAVQARAVTSCTAALPLQVGAIQPVDRASPACLGGESGAEYVIVGFNGQESAALSVTVEGEGLSATASSARASSLDLLRPSRSLGPNRGFEARLRHRERTELPRYLPALRASQQRSGLQPSFSRSAAAPAVGDLLALNTSTEEACRAVGRGSRNIGRVAAVTQRAIVVTDTTNPAGGFTDEEYREIGLAFDTLVYAEITRNFGAPHDIDGNGQIIIFYTRAVNELTDSASTTGYVGGFFFARDLFPTTAQTGFQACEGSNYAEMFYVLAPDPKGEIKGNVYSKDRVRRITIGTIAHELQHLISASRRLYVQKTDNWDEVVWLNEGLSHIAEELVFYRASGLGPKQNLGEPEIRQSEQRRVSFNTYAIDNFGRFEKFLEDPEGNSPYEVDDDLATRGAAWSFLRYVGDRAVTDQAALWKKLSTSRDTSLVNLRAAIGTDPIALARDWAVGVFADDAVSGATGIYQQPSWNFRSIFKVLEPTGYPLKVRTFGNGSSSISLAAGGTTYLRVTPAGTGIASVRFRSGAAPPPEGFSVFVIRTR